MARTRNARSALGALLLGALVCAYIPAPAVEPLAPSWSRLRAEVADVCDAFVCFTAYRIDASRDGEVVVHGFTIGTDLEAIAQFLSVVRARGWDLNDTILVRDHSGFCEFGCSGGSLEFQILIRDAGVAPGTLVLRPDPCHGTCY